MDGFDTVNVIETDDANDDDGDAREDVVHTVSADDDDDDDDEWCQFADAINSRDMDDTATPVDNNSSNNNDDIVNVDTANDDSLEAPQYSSSSALLVLEDIPSEVLHPAVSLGMKRVSSCYFSIHSQNSNLSSTNNNIENDNDTASYDNLIGLLSQQPQKSHDHNSVDDGHQRHNNADDNNNDDNSSRLIQAERHLGSNEQNNNNGIDDNDTINNDAITLLLLNHHEFLMEVFTFLGHDELRSFSETCRRANFEVFYYLSLQLQQSLLVVDCSTLSSSSASSTQPTSPNRTTNVAALNNNNNNNHSTGNSRNDNCHLQDSANIISRLATMDMSAAKRIVDAFLNSNSTLRTLPLSHSLSYLRQYLARKGFSNGLHHFLHIMSSIQQQQQHTTITATTATGHDRSTNVRQDRGRDGNKGRRTDVPRKGMIEHEQEDGGGITNSHESNDTDRDVAQTTFSQQTFTRAALFVTLVGAVGGAAVGGGAVDMTDMFMSFGTTTTDMNIMLVQSMIVRVGFLGSLMMGGARAAKASVKSSATTATSKQEANGSSEDGTSDSNINDDDITTTYENDTTDNEKQHASQPKATNDYSMPSISEMKKLLQNIAKTIADEEEQSRPTVLSNPYDHLPANVAGTANHEKTINGGEDGINKTMTKAKQDDKDRDNTAVPNGMSSSSKDDSRKRNPSGCVGAYLRAVKDATMEVTRCIKDGRKREYDGQSPALQNELSLEFLAACSSNDTLDQVKDIVAQGIDADAFHLGADGQLSCGLHTASFQGADLVVDFLCTGISRSSTDSNGCEDGGLVDVDLCDGNGWSALHFAAGANSVPVIKVLAKHGANPSMQATNGYTPLLWAKRLSNKEAADELSNLAGMNETSSIASRFLALIPTN